MRDPAPATGRLPILMFHAIDTLDRSAIACSPTQFRRVLETLHRAGAHGLGLTEAGGLLRGGAAFPARALVLTFDDGYRSVYETAFPVLQRYQLPATVFLAVGRGRTGPHDALPSMNGRPMLRWGEIRAMHERGIAFGAHTLTHPDLTALPEVRMREEIRESKARIEDALSAPVTTFAYPYGAVNRRVRTVAAERFACACADRLGLVTARSDPFALERVETYYLRTIAASGAIFSPSFAWYLWARGLPRRLRRLAGARGIFTARRPEGSDRSVEEAVHDG